MGKILITGASGLVGLALTQYLLENNFEIVHLSRSKKNNSSVPTFVWDIKRGYLEDGVFENISHIVHLAGAGIADQRWTEKRKQEIIDSRTKSAELLFNGVTKLNNKPDTFISASAIGYYGAITSDNIFIEEDKPADDFQGKVCKLWEKSADLFSDIGIRTVKLRFGVVLSVNGGALKKMLLPTKFGLGSALGSGKQFLPWVHINDVIKIISKSISDNKMQGPYNVVAPSFDTYDKFSSTLAHVLKKPYFLPNVPSFLLRLAFGEMSAIILKGSRISSEKLIKNGYKFQFDNLETALKNLVNPY
jgi:uncharacterized protein (TIGR01777 family)